MTLDQFGAVLFAESVVLGVPYQVVILEPGETDTGQSCDFANHPFNLQTTLAALELLDRLGSPTNAYPEDRSAFINGTRAS